MASASGTTSINWMLNWMRRLNRRRARLALEAEAVAGVTLSLTAGFVSWVLRAGSLMVSFLSAMPLWRQVDPTPILAMDSEESSQSVEESNDDEEKQVEDDAFEDLFAK